MGKGPEQIGASQRPARDIQRDERNLGGAQRHRPRGRPVPGSQRHPPCHYREVSSAHGPGC